MCSVLFVCLCFFLRFFVTTLFTCIYLDRWRVYAKLIWYWHVSCVCAKVLPLIYVSRMSAVKCLAQERIWFDKPRFDEAERKFYERMNGPTLPPQVCMYSS